MYKDSECKVLEYPTNIGFCNIQADKLRQQILNTPNTDNFYKANGDCYYISEHGDDLNKGNSPDNPLRTPEALAKTYLRPGDTVLFERGSLIRIRFPIRAVEGVTYGSYGEGEKPKIYASPENFAEESFWKLTDKNNIWETEFPYEPAWGIFFNDGEKIGNLWKSIDSLNKNGDFHYDAENKKVYLYCDEGNPGGLYNSIEICPKTKIFYIPHFIKDVTIDNLCLKYTGDFAICSFDLKGNVNVTNCEIGCVGGLTNGKVRFGNAVEFYTGAGVEHGPQNIKVEHNWIYQTFDTAVTWQGAGSENCLHDNITFSNNLLEYNNADFEFYSRKGTILKNFKMDKNIMRFTSMGWGTNDIEGGVRGIEGCIRAITEDFAVFENVSFTNNIIDCPARQVINWKLNPEHKEKIFVKGNSVFIKGKLRTMDCVIQGLQNDESEPYRLPAGNLQELIKAFERFDKTAEFKWED